MAETPVDQLGHPYLKMVHKYPFGEVSLETREDFDDVVTPLKLKPPRRDGVVAEG